MDATVVVDIEARTDPAEEEVEEEEASDVPIRLFRALMTQGGCLPLHGPRVMMMDPPPSYAEEVPPTAYKKSPEDESLRRWLEVEVAGPLRFNVSLTRELIETQRRADYLLAENSLLRRRQEERQQLHRELTQCQQRAQNATLDTVVLQQHQLLEQQQQLLRSLKTFAVAFQLGGHADNI